MSFLGGLFLLLCLALCVIARPPIAATKSPDLRLYQGILPYEGICNLEQQVDCCTVNRPIGFEFPFRCYNYNNFSASDNGFLVLGGDACATRKGLPQLNIFNYDFHILEQGSIGEYFHKLQHKGDKDVVAKVIEWSDVTFHNVSLQNLKIGAFQAWLFPNGSIGIVFHVLNPEAYMYPIISLQLQGLGNLTEYVNRNDPIYTDLSPAYILSPQRNGAGDLICDPSKILFNVSIWHNPPDICFNDERDEAFVNTRRSETRSPRLGKHNRPTALPHYKHLKSCGKFSNTQNDGDKNHRVSKKKGSEVSGILAGGLVIVIVILIAVGVGQYTYPL